MDEDEFGRDKKNPFDIVDLAVGSGVGAAKGSADFEDDPFENPFAGMVGDAYDLDIPEVGDDYFVDGVEESDPGLRDATSLAPAVSRETMEANALIAANTSVASITAAEFGSVAESATPPGSGSGGSQRPLRTSPSKANEATAKDSGVSNCANPFGDEETIENEIGSSPTTQDQPHQQHKQPATHAVPERGNSNPFGDEGNDEELGTDDAGLDDSNPFGAYSDEEGEAGTGNVGNKDEKRVGQSQLRGNENTVQNLAAGSGVRKSASVPGYNSDLELAEEEGLNAGYINSDMELDENVDAVETVEEGLDELDRMEQAAAASAANSSPRSPSNADVADESSLAELDRMEALAAASSPLHDAANEGNPFDNEEAVETQDAEINTAESTGEDDDDDVDIQVADDEDGTAEADSSTQEEEEAACVRSDTSPKIEQPARDHRRDGGRFKVPLSGVGLAALGTEDVTNNGGAVAPRAQESTGQVTPHSVLVDTFSTLASARQTYRALYPYSARQADDLSFRVGDEFEAVPSVVQDESGLPVVEFGWLVARSTDGQYGKVPENYLQCANDAGADEVGSESDEGLDDDVVPDGSPRLVLGPDGAMIDDENGEYDVLPKLNILPPSTGIGGFIRNGFGEDEDRPAERVQVNEGKNVKDPTTGQFYTSYSVSFEVSTVPRRYTDFGWLHQTLAGQYPGAIIPPLPPKTWAIVRKTDPSVTKARRRYLQSMLNQMLDHPLLGGSEYLFLFLKSPDIMQLVRGAIKLPQRQIIRGSTPYTRSRNPHEMTQEQRNVVGYFDAVVKLESKAADLYRMFQNLLQKSNDHRSTRREFEARMHIFDPPFENQEAIHTMIGATMDTLHTLQRNVEKYEVVELEHTLEEYKRYLGETKLALLSRSYFQVAVETARQDNMRMHNRLSKEQERLESNAMSRNRDAIEKAVRQYTAEFAATQDALEAAQKDLYVVDRRIHAEMERFNARNNAMVKGLLLQYARIRTMELEQEARAWRAFVSEASSLRTTPAPEYDNPTPSTKTIQARRKEASKDLIMGMSMNTPDRPR